MKQMITK